MNIALWSLQIILGLAFIFAGGLKATQPLPKLAKQMAWVKDVPPGVVRFIGIVEVLGGLGLIIPAATGILPWLTPVAALGLAITMLLAAAFHVRRNEFSTITPSIVLFLIAVVIVFGRFVVSPL